MAERHDERRIVTALFADVAGSTPLSERLDPEEAKLVIGEAINRAIRAVEAYGGTVNNLLGDGLLALFGAPVAHEDDPERAVRAALEIVAGIREYADEVRRGWGVEDFAMRVGIHTGEVVVGQVGAGARTEYGVVGDTINTAARLQGVADTNGVLVSESTYRQVATRFQWGEPRALQLKGKAEPVTAYPVARIKEAASGDAARSAPMVGREAELATAMELFERLAVGGGGVLFIVGEPGIGKSRLAGELRDRTLRQGTYAWFEGRCVSYGESLPYWPFRDLLRNWLEVGPTEPELRVRVKLHRKTEEIFPGHAAEAYPYLGTILGLNLEPEVTAQLKAMSPESVQYKTFEVFGDLLQRISAARPVVLLLDDLHWADSTSLALTERLLSLAESGPVVIAISQRPETEHASWMLKERAAREYRHLVRELALRPLQREVESALLASLAGGRQLPAGVSDRLLAYAEGNPFYLEQLIRSLIDSGTLMPENGHWTLKTGETLQIPQTLEGVIIARIDRLETQWRDVLTAASVLGRTFSLDLVQSVTGLDTATLRRIVHHLLRLDLLREEGGGSQAVYRFKHALIQDAAYHTLVGPRRAMLHQKAAEWFESYYTGRLERVYGLIAHHWLAAANNEKAILYLKLAGDRALAEWALDEAIGHYRALIPLLETADRRPEAAETLFQLASTLHLAMRYREANEAWQLAFRDWRPAQTAESLATATLKIGTPLVPWDPDPAHALYVANMRLHQQLFDSLLEPRPGPYVVPGLARRWDVNEAGNRYRFELQPGLTWNDGAPLTARDIVDGVEHLLAPQTGSHEAAHLFVLENAALFNSGEIADFRQVGVSAIDSHTIEFRLHEPAPYFPFLLPYPDLSGARAGRSSGPFRIRSLTTEHVVLERDPRYRRWHGGNVAVVEWVGDGGDQGIAAMYRGELDVLQALPAPKALQAFADPRFHPFYGPLVRTTFLGFSANSPYASDLHFRRAVGYATDRRRLLSRTFPSDRLATGGFVPPGLPGHTPDVALPFDPDAARRELALSAHSGPFLVSMYGGRTLAIWSSLVDGWAEVLGIDVRIVVSPAQTADVFPEYSHGRVGHWVAAYPDAEYFLRQCYRTQSTSNLSRWSSAGFDALVDRAVTAATGSARLALFHEADKLLVHEECAVVPLVYGVTEILLQPWVHGWWEWGAPWQSFDELTIDERSPRHHAG